MDDFICAVFKDIVLAGVMKDLVKFEFPLL